MKNDIPQHAKLITAFVFISIFVGYTSVTNYQSAFQQFPSNAFFVNRSQPLFNENLINIQINNYHFLLLILFKQTHCKYTALLEKYNVRGKLPNEQFMQYVVFSYRTLYSELFNNCSMNQSLRGTPRTLV